MALYGESFTPKFKTPKVPDPAGLVNLPSAGSLITSHPLCDKNLLKDVDGIASIASLPSLPNLEEVLSASGIPEIPEKLDPKAMFNGVPEFTGLQDMAGIPDQIMDKVNNLDFKEEAKALANDVLSKLNISNPLDDLCGQVTEVAQDAQDQISLIDFPDINNRPPVSIPKFTDVVDIPEVGDIL
tara:strand:+ start:7922 stop:8473 length:552 start_codon:yes stop_codon:yes gene_type:complete